MILVSTPVKRTTPMTHIFTGMPKHMILTLLHQIHVIVLNIRILLGCSICLYIFPFWTLSWNDTAGKGSTLFTIHIRVNTITAHKDVSLRMIDPTV
jgi:hypothetical protein